MDVVVLSALGFVNEFLASTLAIIGLKAAGNAVGSIGGGLFDLVLGGLGGVWGEPLLDL